MILAPGQTDLCLPQCSDDLLRSVSLPSHPDLLAEKLQTRSILTLHLVSFQGVTSYLAISLAIAAAQSGRRVYYGALADLITSLEEAKTAGQLGRRLNILTYPSLLVIDEIGYLPVSQSGAMFFFQLINRRYERASTVLTSNKGFEEWGQILGDDVMAAALIDRLLHHCHIVNIRGNSYRMRKHTDLSKMLHSPLAEPSPSPPRKRRTKAKEKTTI